MNESGPYFSMYSGDRTGKTQRSKPYVEPPPEFENFKSIKEISLVNARKELEEFRSQMSKVSQIISNMGVPLYLKEFTQATRDRCFGSDDWAVEYNHYMIYCIDPQARDLVELWNYRGSHLSSCLTGHVSVKYPHSDNKDKHFYASCNMQVFRHNPDLKHDAERIEYSTNSHTLSLTPRNIGRAIELLQVEYEYKRIVENVTDYMNENKIVF
jgi:hypothetical protein